MKASEIREMPLAEIEKKKRDFHERLLNLHLQVVTGQVEDTAEMRLLRRDIARCETIAKEKQIAEAAAS